MINKKIKKLFSFIALTMLLFVYSPKMFADVWKSGYCVSEIKNIRYEYMLSDEEFNVLCIKKYVLLAEYLRKLELDPLLDIPLELSEGISEELQKAKNLSKKNNDEWLKNLEIMKEAFLQLWKENVPDVSHRPFVNSKSALYAGVPLSEYFRNFIRDKHIPGKKMAKADFRNICFRKYFILDKCVRYLSTKDKEIGSKKIKISSEEIGEIRDELTEVNRFNIGSIKERITIFRTMRDEFLLVLSTDIYRRP